MIFTKEHNKVQNFRLWNAQVKFHQIGTFLGSFCWKYIKFQLKAYRGVMSHDTEEWCKIWKKKWLFVSKMPRIWWILIRVLKSLKKLHFDWSILWKVYNVWPKKVQRSYISCHWRVCKVWKNNWFVVWKTIWGVWQIFIRTLENVKIGTFMGSFCPK